MKTSGQPSLLKICVLMVMLVSYTDTYVFSKPRGGQVVSGTASFTQDGNLTVVTAGNRSIIDYQSFDIGKNETVQFVQPGAHATVLNRVLTPDPTNIFGRLESNGIVIIANPYGVFFQNGSVVNVGGLVAGAGKVSDADFTAGKIHFTDLTGDVRNDGVIAADNQIALMGANVVNTGSLNAMHGMAMMVSGPDVYVGAKNGNIFVQANGKAMKAASAAIGGAAVSTGSVTNRGTVTAPRVLLGAGDMYSTAIVNSGLLQGRSVAVNAGKNGSATIGGTLDASSAHNPSASGQGGNIDVLGGTVALQGAQLDASGTAGGGNVRVGGDFHGASTLAASTTTTVDAASTIKADATGATGNGGTVVLWSGNSTAFNGNISARGGTAGGNGGSVEVSSANRLAYLGFADLRASAGTTGNLLLDPANYVVDADVVTNYGYPTDTSVITPTQLLAQLTTSNTTLAATNDIVFRSDVTANVNANSLTLGAGHSIYIGDPGTNPLGATTPPAATSAALTLGGAFTATYNSTGAAAGVTNARFRMSGTSSITTPGTVMITDGGVNTGNTAGIFALNITTSTGTAGATSGGIVLNTAAGTNEPITLNGALNASANGGVGTNTTGGNVTLTSSGAITTTTPGADTITTNGTGTQPGGAIALTANGAITVSDLAARGRSTGIGGSITLLSAATAATVGAFVTGNLDTSAAGAAGGPIAIGAPLVAADLPPTNLTVGTITTAGNTATNGGSINLQTSGLLTLGTTTPVFTGNTTLLANTTNATSYTTSGYNFSLTLNGASISTSQILDTALNLTLASPNAPFGISLDQNVTTNALQTYNGPVTVTAAGAGVTLTAGAGISFSGTLNDNADGAHNLILKPVTGVNLGGTVGGIHPLLSLDASASPTTNLAGTAVTTTGAQSYVKLTLSGASATLTGSNITATGATNGLGQPLTVTASGTGTFASITSITALTFNGTGATALNGGVIATSLTATGGTGLTLTLPAGNSVTTTGEQNYNEALTLGAAATLVGQGTAANGSTALRFGAGIGGAFALTLNNNTSGVAGVSSDTIFAAGPVSIGSLSASTVGTTQLNNGGITTSAVAGQVFNGPVTLGATTLLTANAAGNVLFVNTLQSAGTTTPQALTIGTTGATTFSGAVGGPTGTGGSAVTTGPALASLNVTGGGTVNVNGGSVTTVTTAGGSQSYSGPVVLGGNTTFKGNTATFTGGITSSTGAGNPFNLTLDLSGLVTLPGLALTGIRDFASVGSGGVLLNGDLTANGNLTFSNGAVTIANSLTLTAGNTSATGSIFFNSPVNDQTAGTHDLTLVTGASGTATINNDGTTTFGSIGASQSLRSLTANGAFAINGTTGVTTSRLQQYGSLTLGGASGALATLKGGNITVTGTTTGNAHPLTVTASGTGTFGGITGAGDLLFNGTGATALGGSITATSLTVTGGTGVTLTLPAGGSVVTTGEQNYNEALTLAAAATLTGQGTAANVGTALRFGAGIGGAFALTLTNTASGVAGVGSDTIFAAGTVSIGSLNASAVGTTQLNNGGITTSAAAGQVYNGAVTLGATTNLVAAGGAPVNFVGSGATVQSAGSPQALSIMTTGQTTFGGAVGGSTILPGVTTTSITTAPALASLSVTGPTTISGGSVTTVTSAGGTQTYTGLVTLGANTTLQGNSATFGGGLTEVTAGQYSLTLDFANRVTLPGTGLLANVGDFTSEGGGGVLINNDVMTNGSQTYSGGPVVIAASVTLTAGTSNPASGISINASLDDTADFAHTLTLKAGSMGSVTIGGAVGATHPLLNLNASQRSDNSSEPVTINAQTVRAGVQSYGPLTLGGTGPTTLTSTLAGGSITAGAVTGAAHGLSVNAAGTSNFAAISDAGGAVDFEVAGIASFSGAITASSFTLGATTPGIRGVFTVLGGGNTVATTLGQTYNEEIFLGAATTLADSGTTTTISLKGVDSATATAQTLVVNTGGTTIFGGAVGATNALASVTTDAAGTTQLNGGTVTTAGPQTYNDAVTLGASGAATTLAAGTGAVTFANTLQSAGTTTPQALTISTSGLTKFGGQVGGAPGAGGSAITTAPALASLTIAGGGNVDINGGGVTTVTTNTAAGTGLQSYSGPVVLGANAELKGNALALAAGLAAGGFNLTLDLAAQVTLPTAITGLGAFSSVGGGGVLISGSFTTAGTQTYSGGNVTLAGTPVLTSTTGSLIFNTPVDGNVPLTLSATGAGGQAIFNGGALVGNTTPLGAFTSNTAAGTIFSMNAGLAAANRGGLNATSVTITGPTTFDETGASAAHPDVLTSLAQTYNSGAVSLNQNTFLTSTGTASTGGITFGTSATTTIDSTGTATHALTLSTLGTQTFYGLIGSTTALGGLTNGPGATVFDMTIPTTNPAVVAAGVRVNGAVVTGGPATFNVAGSNLMQPTVLTLGSGAQTYGTLTNPVGTAVTLQGAVTVLNSANTEPTPGTFSGGGTITFNGNIVAGAASPELDVRAGLGTIEFDSPINTTGDFAPGGVSVIFRGSIGTTANPLGTFTVLPNPGSTGTPLIDLNGGSVVTGGLQSYAFPTVLSANTTLTASGSGNITFSGALDGSNLSTNAPYTLTLTVNGGTVAFNGVVGGVVPLQSLTILNGGATLGTTRFAMNLTGLGANQGGVNVLGPVMINTNTDFEATGGGTTVPTILSGVTYLGTTGAGTQTYGQTTTTAAVTVGQNTILQDLASGSITFNGRVNAATDGGASLSVDTGGDEFFQQLVGGTNRLASLNTDTVGTVGGTTRFNLDLTQAGTVAGVRLTGALNVNDHVAFNATGGTTVPTVLSGGGQTYSLAATVRQNTVLTATSGNITFGDAVDSGSSAGALTVNTPGDEVFNGAVGLVAPLVSLTTDDPAVLTPAGHVVFAFAGTAGVPSVTATGTQTYNDAATLRADTLLTSTGGNLVFRAAVDSDALLTPRALTLNGAGDETFGGRVGGTNPLASVLTDATVVGGHVIFAIPGSTSAAPGVTTTGAQTYNDAALLQSATVLASKGGGALTFKLTVDGAQALTLNTAGNEVFDGAVGRGTALTSLVTDDPAGTLTGGQVIFNVAGSTLAAPSVRTTGVQTYNDAATLLADTVLTSTGGGTLTFASSVDGAHALSLNSAGDEMFNGRVGTFAAPLTSLTTDADAANRGGRTVFNFAGTNATPSVATSGLQTYQDAVFLGAPATLASTAAGDVTFVLTVDSLSAGNAQGLTVNTAGRTIFDGAVGSTNALASVTTDYEGAADLGTQINGGSVKTTNGQLYQDAVVLNAAPSTLTATTLTNLAGVVRFARTLDSASAGAPVALTINGSGQTIFGDQVGSLHALASVIVNSKGGVQFNGGGVTTTGVQTYNGPATLGLGTLLTSTASGTIGFNGTVDGAQTLTVSTAGLTAFAQPVGNGVALTGLTTGNGGTTQFNMPVGAVAGVVVNGPVLINDAVIFNVAGASAAQPTVLTLGNGAQTYNGAVSLGTSTFLVSAASGAPFTGGGAIAFNSAQGISSAGGNDLSVRAGVGMTVVNSPINANTVDLGGAAVTFAGPVNLPGTVSVEPNDGPGSGSILFGGGTINTVGAQLYNVPFVLGNNAVLTSTGGGSITFKAALNGAFSLVVDSTGDEVFSGQVGGTNPLASLNTDDPARIQPGGHVIFGFAGTTASPSVKTTGVQSYNDAAILEANAVLTSTAATGGGITFASTVDGSTAGAYALTLNSVGNQIFRGQVGGVGSLASVTTDDPAAGLTGGSVSFAIAGTPSVTTTGAQTYNNAAVLLNNTVLTSTGGGTLTFANTVNGAFNLTVNSAGDEVFGASVGNTAPLGSLTTDGAGSGGRVIFGPNASGSLTVTTSGAQTYHDAVLLQTAANLVSNAGGNLTFDRTVEGTFALTLDTNSANAAAPGTITLTGAVGGDGAPLASLTTRTGTVVLNGGAVTTTGAQTYGVAATPGAVILGADTTLASTAAGAISFNATVDSNAPATPRGLTINTTGATTFGRIVGGGAALASLTTTSGPVALNGGAVTTTGGQNYGGAVTLGADTVLNNTTVAAGDGTGIVFGSTLDSDTAASPRVLTLNAVGNEVFGGSVGTTPLASLTTSTSAAGQVIFGVAAAPLSVTTNGFQTYNNAVLLRDNTTLVSLKIGDLTFNSTVDGSFDLTLNSAGNEFLNARIGGGAGGALSSLTTDSDPSLAGGNVYFRYADPNGGPAVSTTGGQTYNDGAVLQTDTVLVSTGATGKGTLTFGSTLDSGKPLDGSKGTPAFNLTLNTPGNEVFNGLVGSKRALGNLTTDGAGTPGGQAMFNAADANGNPAVNVIGNVTINDAVVFNAQNVTVQSTAAQTYNGAVTLDHDALLTSTGAGAVTLGSTANGPAALTVNTAGVMTFKDAIGNLTPLASLTAGGGGAIALNAGTGHTLGAQIYNGAVTLNNRTSPTTLISDGPGGINFNGTVTSGKGLTLTTTGDNATTFAQAVNVDSLTATDGSNVAINGGSVITNGLQVYGGTVAVNNSQDTVLTANNALDVANGSDSGNIIFRQAVNAGGGGSLLVQAKRIMAGGNVDVAGGGNLDLEGSNLLVLAGTSYKSDSGAVRFNTSVPAPADASQPGPTIIVANPGTSTRFQGRSFAMGYLQNMFVEGSVSIVVTGSGAEGGALLSDIAALGSINVSAPLITLFAREGDPKRGSAGGADDGLNFVAGSSLNFGESNIAYNDTYSHNNVANFVTPGGIVTVNRNEQNGISIFQDQTALVSLRTESAELNRVITSDRFQADLSGDFSTFFQPISGGTQTIDTAAALSGALPDQKPLDVAVDITISASQLEELLKLGIHPRKAQRQERLSLSSKRALFAQLVDGLDKDNYGRLQPIKGGISTLVPSDYVVVVDRMSEHEVQAILTAFEELYGKNKEKVPPIGEAFNTAFTDYSTEKQTADPAGFAPYIAATPGKYPNVDKAVRGFDNLFGYIEHLGLTGKEQAKAKEHIASDLEVSGVSAEDMVKVIDTLRTKIPKDQKAPSTKLPPSAPAGNPAPGATTPGQPEQKKGTPPLKTATHALPGAEDRLHELAER